MNGTTMNIEDTLSAAEAECYITLDGKRYKAINAVSLEAYFTKTKKEVPILGRKIKGNRTIGGKGTGKMTVHMVTSIFRKKMIDYINTGKDFYFDVQVTNEDPTSSVGRQTVILKGVNFDKALLAKFDANGEVLDEDSDFTFESVEMPEEFNMLAGMQV